MIKILVETEKKLLEHCCTPIQSKSKFWTILAFFFAFLIVIFDTTKLVRVFSLKILRGIPKEFTFELNLILSTSYFCHLMGFVYALGLPELKENDETKSNDRYVDKILSLSAGLFIILVLVFHIISTALLIDYSPPNYLLI